MNPQIETRHDHQRGCGWRKEGGLYLVSDGLAMPCGKLPIPLDKCPCCGAGIKFCRSWTWINLAQVAIKQTCTGFAKLDERCGHCPLGGRIERAGLLWIGEKFYSPEAFTAEAALYGVSRRINTLPKDFKAGETFVAVAHIHAIWTKCPDCTTASCLVNATNGHPACKTCEGKGEVGSAGIFHLFRPKAVEYVVKGDESDEEIDRLVKRGITPVKVERVTEGELAIA